MEQKKFIVCLGQNDNPSRELILEFNVRPTAIAHSWFDVLKNHLQTQPELREPHRVYHFDELSQEREKCVQTLNYCIQAINEFFPQFIEATAHEKMAFQDTNYLHSRFECLRGSSKKPSHFFVSCSEKLKNSIERLNLEIHRFEDFLLGVHEPRLVFTFKDRKRYEIPEKDFAHFTFERTFGIAYANYSEVGRSIAETYRTKDNLVSIENIRPQRFYSPDFNVFLGRNEIDAQKAKQMKNDINHWLADRSDLPFKAHDPKNALGKLPVADLAQPIRISTGNLLKGLDIQKYVRCI